MIKTTAYKCDYCNHVELNKDIIEYHEKTCYYNKDYKACINCKYYLDGFTDKDGCKLGDISNNTDNCPHHELSFFYKTKKEVKID